MSLEDTHAKGNYILAARASIIGSKIVNSSGEELGKIEDVVIDTRTNQVAYAILSFGGFLGLGEKHFAIPWETIRFDAVELKAKLDIDKDRLKNAPGFDKESWPDMANSEWATQIRRHYGHKSQ